MNQTEVLNPAAGVVQPPPILDALVDKIKFPDGADKLSEAPLNQDEACGASGPSGDATHPHSGDDDLAAALQNAGEMPNAEGVLTAVEQDALPQSVPEPEPKYGRPVHPVCDLFPLMGEADLTKLAEDIRVNGLAHPVVVHEGQIVDGRNRDLACRQVKVEPTYVEWCKVYTGLMSLGRWIWSANAERRHLTPVQIAAAYLAVNGWEERDKARQRQAEGRQQGGEIGGRGRLKADSLPTIPSASYLPEVTSHDTSMSVDPVGSKDQKSHSGDRRTKMVEEFGISHSKAQTLLCVEKEAPELLTDVVQGKIPLLEAGHLARAKKSGRTVRSAKKGQQKEKMQKKNTTPNEHGGAEELGAQLEKLIGRAVRAVEKVLRTVREDQQEMFKVQVADTVRRLA